MSVNRTLPRRGKSRGKGANCSGENPPRPKSLKKQKASAKRAHFYRTAKSRSSQVKSMEELGRGRWDKTSSNVITSDEMRDLLQFRTRVAVKVHRFREIVTTHDNAVTST